MKTFVILSDSHGRNRISDKIAPLAAENDYVIHLGDGAGDLREVMREYPEKTYLLKGNCDFSAFEEECVIQAEGISILCCHGHKYGVKSGISRLAYRAKELDCEVALYGHTHRASVEEVGGVLCINPGSAGSYSDPSYCYLVVHNKKPTATIVSLL